MSLGLCCQWIEQRTNRNGKLLTENILDEKSLQLGAYKNGKYTRERILQTYRGNVKEILRVIPYLNEHGIKSFRLSSSIFPLFEFCGDVAKNDEQIKGNLALAGRRFKESGIRVTCHPGQFCVISSDSDRIVSNSIRELEYHAWMFDAMGFEQTPYYAINIHGGKANRSERILEVFASLPDNIKKRLTLENDENTEIGMENAVYNKKRAHSQLIRYVPEQQLQAMRDDVIDVDVEAKLKNIALIKMRKDFGIKN